MVSENQQMLEKREEAAFVAEVKGFWRVGTIAYHRQPAAATITLVENGEVRWRSARQKRIKLSSQPYYTHCNKAQ